MTFCADMLTRAMEDMSHFLSVLSADPAADSDLHENFARLSKYGVGSDPFESGDLDRMQNSNTNNMDMSLGYAVGGEDSGVKGLPVRYAVAGQEGLGMGIGVDQSYESIQLSELLSPGGLSVAQSFSRMEGRLSLTPRADNNNNNGGIDWQNSSNVSGDLSHYDNGGYLDDSFE